MESVIQFAIAAKNAEIAAQALKSLREVSPLAARVAARQLKQSNVAAEEVEEEKKEEEKEEEEEKKVDWSDVSTIMYVVELKGVGEAEQLLEKAGRSSLEKYGACYAALKRLGASGELLQKFMDKAKEFYLHFDEYVDCMHLCSVCFRTNSCVLFLPAIFSDSLRMKRIGKLVATGLGGLLALEGYYGFVCQNCINMQI